MSSGSTCDTAQKFELPLECRDKGRPVEIGQVDGFIAKSQSVNANFKAMVSRAGFTKDAIELAKSKNIGTLSLLPADDSTVGFRVNLLLTFDRSRLLQVNGKTRSIAAIRFSAFREIQVKTKFLTISGQAFYNWQDEKWHWPDGGFIATGVISPDLSD